jgi:hypothetical protein
MFRATPGKHRATPCSLDYLAARGTIQAPKRAVPTGNANRAIDYQVDGLSAFIRAYRRQKTLASAKPPNVGRNENTNAIAMPCR